MKTFITFLSLIYYLHGYAFIRSNKETKRCDFKDVLVQQTTQGGKDSSDPVKQNTKGELRAIAKRLYDGGNFVTAADSFYSYSKKYVDDPYGYYMIAMSTYGIDKNVKNELIKMYIDKAIGIALNNSDIYKSILLGCYKYFVMYYSTIDKSKSKDYVARILELDPNDKDGLKLKKKY